MARDADTTIDILKIDVIFRVLELEAKPRYLSDPDNLKKICRILRSAIDALREIRINEKDVKCPPGWHHLPDCRCWPDELNDPLLAPPEEKDRIEDRIEDRIDNMERRLRRLERGAR